jgi:hypothetical protein
MQSPSASVRKKLGVENFTANPKGAMAQWLPNTPLTRNFISACVTIHHTCHKYCLRIHTEKTNMCDRKEITFRVRNQ